MEPVPQVKRLSLLPQFEQRTPEWYQQRENAITASDIPTVLGENAYKTSHALLLDKCNANPKPFTGNEATRWGNHYEDIAIEKYSQLKNKTVLSFGLLIHPEHPWLGGSPDGITTDGILLEVKCPLKRKIIPGEVPHHYLSQVLLNLEICDLEMAHFIEFVPGNSDDDYEINIVEVKRDREWFSKELPKMKEFWDSVLFYRENGIEKHPKYRKRKEIKKGKIIEIKKVTEVKPLFINEPEPEIKAEPLFINEPKIKIKKVTKPLFIEELEN
jgi:putative phage-type endonuclease